jgi:hypothetical protein
MESQTYKELLTRMVETDQNACAIASMFPDRIELRGYGRQESLTLSTMSRSPPAQS